MIRLCVWRGFATDGRVNIRIVNIDRNLFESPVSSSSLGIFICKLSRSCMVIDKALLRSKLYRINLNTSRTNDDYEELDEEDGSDLKKCGMRLIPISICALR